MRRKLIVAIGAVLCALGIVPLLKNVDIRPKRPEKTAYVILTDKGFTPSEVTIPVGGSVLFENATKNTFWPASNNHPAHSIYPEFDPKRPLKTGEEWVFTFSRVGDWGYHDHVRSYFVGVVHVVP